MPVSYLICAAGAGSRTSAIAPAIPKPFLRLQGQTLLRRSVRSLPVTRQDQVIILHSSAMKPEDIHKELDDIAGSLHLLEIKQLTRGQLETALLGLSLVPKDNSACIFNADTEFKCESLSQSIESGKWDGLIPCNQQPGTAWSFCAVAESASEVPSVTAVAEKNRISDWCSVGLYWFKTKEMFQKYAQAEILAAPPQSEIYVAPVYNRLLADGLKVGMNKAEVFKPMGSIEQITQYWGLSLKQIQDENTNL